jgi:hypothetical protein
MCPSRLLAIPLTLIFAALCAPVDCAAADKGRLEVRIVDKETSQPMAARMHLKDQRGNAVKPPKVPYWKDHFALDGTIVFELPLGTYTFDLEAGPEYKAQTGYFTLERNANDTKSIEMQRFVDMKKEGWWSGDLHIHRPAEEIEPLMRSEDLHIGPVITWWANRRNFQDLSKNKRSTPVSFDGNRFYQLLGGEDEREGGALLFFNLPEPLPLTGSKPEYPSGAKFVELARQMEGAHIDVEKPFWWDMPMWVATGKVNTIGLANNHQHRDGMLDNEAWGKPRETALYPGPQGNGRWSEHIYYQLLNCGLRIPPSAGSASGVLPNPVGYNRVYVHCGDTLEWDKWWENLRLGRVMVTNGPLLRPRVFGPGVEQEGALPGHVFHADQGKSVELQIELNLATRDPIEYLEVVQDGKTVHEVRLDQWVKAGGNLPPVKFDRSGWFLIKAVTSNPKTFRFASTGPYYVEIGYDPRVSKKSAQFFVDWVYERAARIKLDDARQKDEVLEFHRHARDFWRKKLEAANAE